MAQAQQKSLSRSLSYSPSSPQLHLLYTIHSHQYLRLLDGADWKEKGISYLSLLWNQVKDDPNPALVLGFGEEGAPGVKEGGASPQKIVEIARGCEERGINFFLQIAGPTPPPYQTLNLRGSFQSRSQHLQGDLPK